VSEVQKLLPDGVYIGLGEAEYFAQPRIGSTDLCKLFLRGEGFWWSSHFNPDYVSEPEDSKARVFGKALHALVLEGDAAFEARFAIIPAKEEERAKHGDKFCVTVGDIEKALEARGMHPKRMTKAELIPYARSRAPDLVIWDVVEDDWRRKHEGMLPVSTVEWRQLQIMVEAIRNHAEVGKLFTVSADNIPLPELSVLYTDEHGIARRVRFDNFYPQMILDLKALSNVSGRPLPFAIGEHVAKYAYFCQLADHQFARKWLMRLVAGGRVYGGTDLERRWLSRFPTDAPPSSDYAWIFYQRPDAKAGHAPIVFPWVEDHGSDLHMDGIRARRKAIATYLRCMAQFGPDKPWTRVEPVHTTAEGAPYRVFVPHYVAQEAVPGEDEDL
jgi:hypothetical protein